MRLVGRQACSGVYSSPVSRSMSVAWRWVKVPRRLSWPDSRTVRPSITSEPNANSSAVAQSTLPELAIAMRRSICGLSRGCIVKPSGGFA